LTVWLCSDTTDRHKHVPPSEDLSCAKHRSTVGRELARHLVSTCTGEGELVVEAFTTTAATLIAAAELDRHALACVPHLPLAQHVGARLRAELPADRLKRVAMRPCRPDQIHLGMADLKGEVSLIVAEPPAHEIGGRTPKSKASRHCPTCRSDLWMLDKQQLGAFLTASWRVLRPGGRLAVITTARHQDGRLVDAAPQIIHQAATVGFRYAQHVIALRVPVEGDALLVQSDPCEVAQLRDIRTRALPPAPVVHADVSLFVKNGGALSEGDDAR
jgi:hypothetical protein